MFSSENKLYCSWRDPNCSNANATRTKQSASRGSYFVFICVHEPSIRKGSKEVRGVCTFREHSSVRWVLRNLSDPVAQLFRTVKSQSVVYLKDVRYKM